MPITQSSPSFLIPRRLIVAHCFSFCHSTFLLPKDLHEEPSYYHQHTKRFLVEDTLCGDQWLILLQEACGLTDWWCLELIIWCDWEILTLEGVEVVALLLDDGWGGRASTGVANKLLCLGRVITNVLLCGRGSAGSLLAGESAHLLGLLVGDCGSLVELSIDKILVGLVDEWA